jgi:hypothetical protein
MNGIAGRLGDNGLGLVLVDLATAMLAWEVL